MSTRQEYANSIRASLMREQKGECAICGLSQIELNRQFAMDHCHKSRKVRGLLCSNCNSALGMFKDSIPVIRRAIAYLSQPTDGRPEIFDITKIPLDNE